MYMKNRSGVIFPLNANLLSNPDLGFTECLIDGSDVPAGDELTLASEVEVLPEAVSHIPDRPRRGRPPKV